MLGTAVATGAIVVDSGARAALLEQHKSLLPAGVVDARGTFDRGDVVPIVTTTGERIAVGIANYAAHEVRRLAGKRSSEVQQALGYTYGDEVVHRNNMVAG
jgi:glutamate 5-kinase